MQINQMLKTVERFALANSPALLTGVAVTGTATAAILAGGASFKAAKLLNEKQLEIDSANENATNSDEVLPPLDSTEKAKLIWTFYIPAASAATTAIIAAIAANQIGTRRTAAMAAAYSITDRAFEQYKDKVVEKFGEKKEEQVRDEVAQDQVTATPVPALEMLGMTGQDVLCFDTFGARYFPGTMEGIRKAVNDVNSQINSDNYASLNDFYDALGIEGGEIGEQLGWAVPQQIDVRYSSVMSPNGRPCIAINFNTLPHGKYETLVRSDY